MSLEKLIEASRYYGSNPEYVLAGGGNTSYKDEDFLFVKASGISLGSIQGDGFVKMERRALSAIWKKDYPENSDAREAAVLADMMASRCPGEESKRPSVETLLHDLLPFSYVIHTHPALVNGLCCSRDGEKAARELFPNAAWIPLINPGYVLSKFVKEVIDKRPRVSNIIILLQNHGIFVAADSIQEINEVYKTVMQTLNQKIVKTPDFDNSVSTFGNSEIIKKQILAAAEKNHPDKPWLIKFERNNQIAAFVSDNAAFKPVSSAYTPDHMVYSGSDPLFIDEVVLKDMSGFEAVFKDHAEKKGRIPKIIAVKELGIFGLEHSEKAVDNALELFGDTQKVAVYSESFGGPFFMNDSMIHFINNCEVERYRSHIAVK